MKIGHTEFREKRFSFVLRDAERRRHLAVIGKTGTGKTNFVIRAIRDDVNNGECVVLLDTRGDAAARIFEYLPQGRAKEILYIRAEHPRDVREADIESVIARRGVVVVDVARTRMSIAEARQSAYSALHKVWEGGRAHGRAGAPIHLFIDGLEGAAGYTFIELLNVSASCGIDMVVTFEYFGELQENVRQAMLGDFGHYVVSTLGPRDAELMAPFFAPHAISTELTHVRPGEFFTTARLDEMNVPVYRGVFDEMPQKLAHSAASLVTPHIPSATERERERVEPAEVPESVLRDILGTT